MFFIYFAPIAYSQKPVKMLYTISLKFVLINYYYIFSLNVFFIIFITIPYVQINCRVSVTTSMFYYVSVKGVNAIFFSSEIEINRGISIRCYPGISIYVKLKIQFIYSYKNIVVYTYVCSLKNFIVNTPLKYFVIVIYFVLY